MITLLSSIKDAFANPDSPWYYAVGAGFLALIILAVVIYIAVSKKLANKNADSAEAEAPAEAPAEKESASEQKPEEPDEQPEHTEEAPVTEEKPEEQEAQEEQPAEKPAEDGDEQPVKEESVPEKEPQEPEQKPEKPAAKKSAVRESGKPFIDRIIADKDTHGVYNELKNSILSYPGIKAKLVKTEEQFFFGADKKAALGLESGKVVLYLKNEPDSIPSQFGVQKSDGDLPAKLAVEEKDIDMADRLITFAMNVSLLTKNASHRRVDYVQRAIDAKNRAKKK